MSIRICDPRSRGIPESLPSVSKPRHHPRYTPACARMTWSRWAMLP